MVKKNTATACAILSYFVIGLVWFFADDKMRDNKFSEFHAKQALIWLITALIIYFSSEHIPVIGEAILIGGTILLLIWWVLGVSYAFKRKKKKLFWIGQFVKHL